MKLVEITESKLDKMSDMLEEMLMLGGKLMHCISSLQEEDGQESYSSKNKYKKNKYEEEDEPPYKHSRNSRYASF